MNWYTMNAGDISFFFLLALSFMGIAVTFIHSLTQRSSKKLFLTIMFILFATIAWHSNKTDRQVFETRLTGGNHFAFVRVRPETKQTGKNFIAITTTGALPTLHIGIHPLSLDGSVLGEEWLQYRDLPPTTFHPPVVLKPGRYRINFLMIDKAWTEYLEFEQSEKGVEQVFWIERNGEVIHREP